MPVSPLNQWIPLGSLTSLSGLLPQFTSDVGGGFADLAGAGFDFTLILQNDFFILLICEKVCTSLFCHIEMIFCAIILSLVKIKCRKKSFMFIVKGIIRFYRDFFPFSFNQTICF